MKTHSLDLY